MKIFSWTLLPVLILAATAIAGCATSTPFAGAGQPHATVILNGSPRAQGLYPVRVRTINGHLTARQNQPLLQLKPGRYTLGLRPVNIRHMENLPGMVAGNSPARTRDTLTVTLQPGKSYYVAARIQQNGNWHPVVWKTTD
ncbi:MAG TPA: hypothetical protein VFK96_07895 [Gammaproteobacteria bacterium]|nr:hypothetical protein [Gammaproteobacteria bacterium]